jgi:hypothetical protein
MAQSLEEAMRGADGITCDRFLGVVKVNFSTSYHLDIFWCCVRGFVQGPTTSVASDFREYDVR